MSYDTCLEQDEETKLKRAPDTRTIQRLPTALTAPPPRPRAMPKAEIVIWTPALAYSAVMRSIAELFAKPVRGALREEA
ncbi:hypothetical protein GCM10008941_14620 [Rhizomicrobium palustre]